MGNTIKPRPGEQLGTFVRRVRLTRGHSQGDLAAILGNTISQATISRFELGESLVMAEANERALAKYLRLTLTVVRDWIERERLEQRKRSLTDQLRQVDAQLMHFG